MIICVDRNPPAATVLVMMAIPAEAGEPIVEVSDATLVLGTRNGDRSAFAELYDRRARLIRAVCYDQTHDLDAAADLAQEAFLRAYRNLGALRDPDRFAGWLVGIARQVCREWRRGRRRQQNRLAGYAHEMAARGPQYAPEPPDERLANLRAAIAGSETSSDRPIPALAEKERLALHTYYLQGLDVEQARHVLGLSRSGFYRVLTAACDSLRKALTTREVRS